MRLIVFVFSALLLLSSLAIAGFLEGTVVKVADGDTITVLDSDKQQHRVRIAGVDAPEKGQPFGNASRKRMCGLVARKEVRVEFQKHDRYGRIVGKVWVTPIDCLTCGKTLDDPRHRPPAAIGEHGGLTSPALRYGGPITGGGPQPM